MISQKPRGQTDADELVHTAQAWMKNTPPLLSIGMILLALGFLGMIALRNGFFTFLFEIGLLLLFIYAALYLPRILAKDQVIDQWDYLISGAEGQGESVVETARQLLTETRAPDVKLEYREISPGLIRGLLGTSRCFLVIANIANFNLKPFQLYLNTRDYGVNLQVCWYLIQRPSSWYKAMMVMLCIPLLNLLVLPFYLVVRFAVSRQSGLLGLDIFDEQDLRAYVTNAHHCVLEAVEKLMLDLHQDPSQLQRCSKGFLGIS